MYCSLGTLFYENKKGKLSVILLVSAEKKQSPCDALFYFFILNVILFTMLQSININISKGCAAKEGTITVISI